MPRKEPTEALAQAGARFRAARKKAGYTAVQLRDLSGVDQPAITRFERGDRGVQADRLLALLQAGHEIGINLQFVLTGDGPELRQAIAITDDPELLDKVTQLVRVLESRHGAANPPRQLPAPRSDED